MCKVHCHVRIFQAVAMMLCRMTFQVYGKLVALHSVNSTAKAYLCNQVGRVSPFLSRLACQILSLTSKLSITLIPAYMPTHLNVEANYLLWGQMLLDVHFNFGVYQRWICWHHHVPHNISSITPRTIHDLWGPWG